MFSCMDIVNNVVRGMNTDFYDHRSIAYNGVISLFYVLYSMCDTKKHERNPIL